jgi:hypothetical protein
MQSMYYLGLDVHEKQEKGTVRVFPDRTTATR